MRLSHLTEEELRQYRLRKMPPSELLAADDHLVECGDCRQSLARIVPGAAGSAGLWQALTSSEPPSSRHLSHEELAAFAENDWSKADRQQVTVHLEHCPQCSEDAEDLRKFHDDLAQPPLVSVTKAPVTKVIPSRRSFFTVPVWAGAAAVIVLAIFLGYRFFHANPQPGSSMVVQLVVQLKDGGGAIGLDSVGRLSSPRPFDPGDEKKIKDALVSKRIEPPAVLPLLSSPQGTLLGSAGAPQGLQLIAPLATAVPDDKPIFRWRPMPQASSYVVSIYDSRYGKLVQGPPVTQNEWQADRALPRGQIYTWQLTAKVKGKLLRAPLPPAPEARFQVLSQSEAEQLEKARREHADSHLLLGLLYAQAGALDDSIRELTALLAANPDSGVAQELLASVQQLRQRR